MICPSSSSTPSDENSACENVGSDRGQLERFLDRCV